MSEDIIKDILEKQKEIVKKAEKAGYSKALSDLWSELQIKELDGFMVSNEMVRDVIEMLMEKK